MTYKGKYNIDRSILFIYLTISTYISYILYDNYFDSITSSSNINNLPSIIIWGFFIYLLFQIPTIIISDFGDFLPACYDFIGQFLHNDYENKEFRSLIITKKYGLLKGHRINSDCIYLILSTSILSYIMTSFFIDTNILWLEIMSSCIFIFWIFCIIIVNILNILSYLGMIICIFFPNN